MRTDTLLLLPLPLLLLVAAFCGGDAQQPPAAVRQYYIAAVEIGWDYIHVEDGDPASEQRKKPKDIPQKYIKAVYREYLDATYTVPKPRPAWTGIQGPVIVAQAGETVLVHFKNLASQPYSISPVGISYWKHSEGAGYDDSTAGHEKEDDAVYPGGYYEYVWDISPKDGPTGSDPECLTYSYSSQVDPVRDVNSGLIGALLICKMSAFTDEGQRRNQAFVLLFVVFDESKSWYGEVGERKSRDKFKRSDSRKEFHTINGYINATLPGLKICQGRNPVIWHLIGMGTAPAIHLIQFQHHTLEVLTHRKVTVEVTPMTFVTAEMKPATVGSFLISCQIHAPRHDGMSAMFLVEKCPDPVVLPGPDMRNAKPSNDDDYDYNYDGEEMFNIINFKPKELKPQVRSSRGANFQVWEHYIAIEELTWDYTPHLSSTDSELQSRFFPTSASRLSYKYKKVAFVEYTDKSFTRRKNTEKSLMGPLLKGKVGDQIHIMLKNTASRPFNIYPNGLSSIRPMKRSKNASEKDLRTMGVGPNETFGYIWELTANDRPLEEDPQCLTQLYQSTVDPEKDLASGLVGTLLICKNEAIDQRGRLVGPDKDWSLVFAVFDENNSWYMKENIHNTTQTPTGYNDTDPDVYNSHVIYTVNGIMFRRRQFVICKTDVAFWHVASVGTPTEFLSVYFTGNLFQHQGLYQSVLTLFPMSGLTVSMEPEVVGEWEIGAFDGSLKSRGMSIQYTVLTCEREDLLVDHELDEVDFSDYVDNMVLGLRGMRPRNHTVLLKVCNKVPINNSTHSVNTSTLNATDGRRCYLKKVTLTPPGGEDANITSGERIPEDILEELQLDGEVTAAPSGILRVGEQALRRRRQAEDNSTDFDIYSGDEGGEERSEIQERPAENRTTANATGINRTKELEEGNEILLTGNPGNSKRSFTVEPVTSEEMVQNYIMSEEEKLKPHHQQPGNIAVNELSVEYDDYNQEENSTSYVLSTDYMDLRSGEVRYPHYYIAAEEVTWDYGVKKPYQLIRPREMSRGMRKFLPQYKKVVYRAYKDESFRDPVSQGELEAHLGILGPFIKAEVNDLLTVVFKNNASRPYSFHLHGVYDRNQGASGVLGKPLAPGEVQTYNWRITKTQGPMDSEFDCKTGTYYSTVDKERDLNSGLIGPLVICKPGTLSTRLHTQPDVQEFALLFHTFDETKSWYMEENLRRYCAPPCHANTQDPWYHISNKFAAINGYVAESLPGLLVAQHQRVRWHLLNVGSDGEYHAVHFHGLPFTVHAKKEHRMGVYNLFPGVFGTVEMRPPTVGTWLVECTVGESQLAGMRAKLLVYNPQCSRPLGMKSGRIGDSQIKASDYIGNWLPHLARLDQSGYINAWMGYNEKSWIQVDLQAPTLLHRVQTQGVRSNLRNNYITAFTVSYSLDQETWSTYRGSGSSRSSSSSTAKVFNGNLDNSRVKNNPFVPPFVARYIRIHPLYYNQRPALRMELLGCDLNSCSLPLGLQDRRIPDESFVASSSYWSLLRSWTPSLARLHQEGSANAWRPKNNNPHEWLQVDLGKVKRITGVVTQGARSLLTKMMVTEFSVTISRDGQAWSSVLEGSSQREKIFQGNNDSDEEALTIFDAPLFGRYIRIHPLGWINDIALRLEVLGCDTQQAL
uniref:Coagulation factor VIII, procoagulant component n=1 Tax=Takifugu rubripes TaxID=31033 RepID=H2UN37_TAKRU